MRISMVLAGLVALSAVACGGSYDGDGKGGSSTNVSTNIPDDTKAGDLTQAQADELCDAAAAAAKASFSDADLKKATCGFSAWTAATFSNDASMCKSFYDECMKAPATSDPEPNESGECTKPSSACTATVGEIEKCMSDTFAQLKGSLAAFPDCSDVGKEIDEDSFGPGESPASCKVVEQKCPEALEGVESPGLPGISDGAQDNAPPAGQNG